MQQRNGNEFFKRMILKHINFDSNYLQLQGVSLTRLRFDCIISDTFVYRFKKITHIYFISYRYDEKNASKI